MAKPRSAACCTLLLLALALAGCGDSRPPASAVRMLIESSPTNLDPRIGTDAQSERIDSLIFDPLVQRTATFTVVPSLAASWETPDPLTYIFHLRHDVRFSNGQPLTSRDVKWSLDTILNGTVLTVKTASFRTWKSVDAPDPYTVIVHLNRPDSSLLWNVCDGVFGVMPYGSGPEIWRHPIGSGPFLFVSQAADKNVILRRNPLYWGTPAKVATIDFMVVPDAITRALELQKGSADIAENNLPDDLLPTLATAPHLRVETAPGTVIYYFIFNLRDHYLGNLRVREAVAAAIDRPLIIRTLLDGHARLAESVLPPEHWAWTGDVAHHPYDPAAANRLLDEAGYPRNADGVRFHIVLKSSTDQDTRMLCAVVQSELARIGIAVDLRSYEFATFYSDITRGAFELAPSRWIGGNESPWIFNYAYASSSIPPHGADRGYYRNAVVDARIHDALTTNNRAQQINDYRIIQQQLSQDLPVEYLWYKDTIAVVNKRLSPLALMPSGNYDFLRTVRILAAKPPH